MQSNEPNNQQNSKPSILTQKAAIKERLHRMPWIIAISALPFFGIVTAFGLAPQTATSDISIETVIEDVALPSLQSKELTQNNFWASETIRRDDTLASLLKRLNIRNAEAIEFLRTNQAASPLASQLRPGQAVRAQTTQNGDLIALEYTLSNNTALYVNQTDNGYTAKTEALKLNKHNVIKSAEIKSSLFGATDAADIPDAIALEVVDIFSGDIDFQSDLRRGDRLAVIYEAEYNEGLQVTPGQVLSAEFTNNGKTYRAVMFRDENGRVSYFTPEGKSLHKSFLRSPLEFSRISSGFSTGRLHPILGTMRAHKGTDYAAPIGTRVKASGDGVVDFVGVKSGYGNVVVLEHANKISTVYGHLSHFAPNLHRGMKVSQGDVIAYVGMTGLATGPHLHYEFLLNGNPRDPVTIALPNAQPIPEKYKQAFFAQSASFAEQLHLLQGTSVASID